MKVSFDLKSNSFCEFYKNDVPSSIQSSHKPDKPEINKNSARNSKKKNRKKLKIALSEFLGKLYILSPQEQKKEIKEFVAARNLTREESVSLTLYILNGLSNYKTLSRTDSKIDMNSLQDSTVDNLGSAPLASCHLPTVSDITSTLDPKIDKDMNTTANHVLEKGSNAPIHIPTLPEKPLKFDFYQTGQHFVVIFYFKNAKSCTLDFIDDRKVKMETCSRVVELEFDRDLEKEGTVQICEFNLKIGIKKLDTENVSFKIIKNDSKDCVQSLEDSLAASKENAASNNESLIKSRGSAEIGALLPQYVDNRQLKELSENFIPLENVCGLLNPGIDCYIITIIQCLFSIKSFTNLLSRGTFISEININNPLSSSKGQMAICLANVLSRMIDQNKPFVLTSLKRSISKFWGFFDPYQQQDAEEILNFFLDTLHEELNNAPRTKYSPREDLPDMELAYEYFKSHSLLNQSLIADTFQGFYKSKLTCSKCGHASRKFEPFMNLSIEVPAPPTIRDVLVIDSISDLSKRRISIPVQKSFQMKEIYKNILARLEKVENVDIIGVVIQNLKITHIVDKEKPLSHYFDTLDNVVYYLVLQNMPYVLVEHSIADMNSSIIESFGIPFITSVDCIGQCDLKEQIMTILTKSIVNAPLNSIDLFDIIYHSDDGDEDAPFDLQPNSVIQTKLLWKSKEIKDYYYQEEIDFQVIPENEKIVSKNFTLEDCLRHFFQEEIIEWRCEKCKVEVEATKKLDLWSCPDLLIIHLKRFTYSIKFQKWTKHNTLIDYPVSDFDLSSFRLHPDQSDIYDLVAVSNHLGSMDRGHYTAFGQRGSKWYHFDDEVVSEVKKEDLVGPSGYILFYQKRSI